MPIVFNPWAFLHRINSRLIDFRNQMHQKFMRVQLMTLLELLASTRYFLFNKL